MQQLQVVASNSDEPVRKAHQPLSKPQVVGSIPICSTTIREVERQQAVLGGLLSVGGFLDRSRQASLAVSPLTLAYEARSTCALTPNSHTGREPLCVPAARGTSVDLVCPLAAPRIATTPVDLPYLNGVCLPLEAYRLKRVAQHRVLDSSRSGPIDEHLSGIGVRLEPRGEIDEPTNDTVVPQQDRRPGDPERCPRGQGPCR